MPYKALYRMDCPRILVAAVGTATIQGVKEWVEERKVLTKELKDQLQPAKNNIKQQTDKHWIEEYSAGSCVYLKLQSYRQISAAARKNYKLAAKYYGPFETTKRVGQVEYKLRLPENSQIHSVFHVSLLKPCPSAQDKLSPTMPLLGEDSQFLAKPEIVLERRMIKRGKSSGYGGFGEVE